MSQKLRLAITDFVDAGDFAYLSREDALAIAELLRGAESTEKDAERYRQLRGLNWSDRSLTVAHSNDVKLGAQTYSGKQLDEIIDDMLVVGTTLSRSLTEANPDLASRLQVSVQQAIRQHNQTVEAFIAAYLNATGAKIVDTRLCQRTVDGVIQYWCEPRSL